MERERVEEREALITQAREADLVAVVQALGAEPDRYDRHKWRLEGHILSIRGGKFYDHLHGQGGGGAIDLVMHLRQMEFREAVSYLNQRTFPESRVAQAREQRQPFQPPRPCTERWPAVRAYLSEERALPLQIVDALHAQGWVYADAQQHAVFLRRDAGGQATGASLRGTRPGDQFKGLAPGSVREAGYFHYTVGRAQPYTRPQLLLTESPIDALSLHALRLREGMIGQTMFLSTDGAGALPMAWLSRALQQGWSVVVAVDHDRAGDLYWDKIQAHLASSVEPDQLAQVLWRTLPPYGKDWNQSLGQAVQEQRLLCEALEHGR